MADGGLSPSDLALLQSLGINPGELMSGSTGSSSSPVAQAAADVVKPTGPLGQLPAWAQGVAAQVYQSPSFQGEIPDGGWTYLSTGRGETTTVKAGTPPNKFAPDFDPASIPTEDKTTVDREDNALTATQAQNLPYLWDEDEVQAAMEKLRRAGLKVETFDDLVSAWGGLVERASITYTMSEGQRKLTPWDVLDLYKNESKDKPEAFTGSKTQVSRNVTDVDEGEAWMRLQGTLSELLGRDPSDQETRDFTYRMGQLAARNPSISKTVTSYKDGEATGRTTHSSPGFTAADMAHEAYDEAQNDPGYAEYRSGSYYFNAAMQALGAIGG